MIDIERLHKILQDGQINEPGSGRTYAICCLIAGLMEFHPNERLVVVVDSLCDVHHIRSILNEVFTELELILQPVTMHRYQCLTTKTMIEFRSRYEWFDPNEFTSSVVVDARRDIHPGFDTCIHFNEEPPQFKGTWNWK
jgi:hypothetical protein